jgi:ribonucleoside-triphosphate reductase
MLVIKRDGRKQKFNSDKIINAVQSAFEKVDGEITKQATDKAKEIAKYVETMNKTMTVEEIQDIVENKLMASSRKDVAKEYILYRQERTREREKNTQFFKDVNKKAQATDVQNQNANVDEKSFGGRKGEADSELMKKLALDTLMSNKARENHLNNRIYTHDLDNYYVGMHNCLTIPFDDLLKNGFNTRQTDVRPANSVNTAMQLIAVIFQIQSLQQFGGVSASHIDWTFVPYVRKSFWKHFKDGLKYVENEDWRWDKDFCHIIPEETSIELCEDGMDIGYENNWKCGILDEHMGAYKYAYDMTVKEIYQATEGLFHNLNTLQSRSGNQLPFTSINYGTCILEEGRLITKAILDTSIKGIGKNHRTSVFPCQIFQVMKGVNKEPNTPNYDLYQLALKSTAKRLYPNYANVDWSTNEGYDRNNPDTYVSTMGCRTYNGFDMNGFGQMKDGRGNIAPVTIIMPTIAMESKLIGDQMGLGYEGHDLEVRIDAFIDNLDDAIHDAKDILIERYQHICSQSPESASFMYENGTMRGYVPEEGIRSALKHGTLAIGQIGLAETLQILIGCNQLEPKGLELGQRIEKLFNDRCAEFKHELHKDPDGYEYYLNFGVYLTPAENLCYTAMQKFKAQYGEIPNVSDREYFTNSTHVPVWEKIDPFTKIRIEAALDKYSNAGCITYVEFESSIQNNIEALETIVNYAMEQDLPYFAVNVPNDQCQDCGYTDMINECCPICGGTNIRRLRRVTGYLTGDYKTAFNKGKQAEVEDRYQHSKQMRWEKQYTF